MRSCTSVVVVVSCHCARGKKCVFSATSSKNTVLVDASGPWKVGSGHHIMHPGRRGAGCVVHVSM